MFIKTLFNLLNFPTEYVFSLSLIEKIICEIDLKVRCYLKEKNAINLEIENHSNKIIFFAIKFVAEYIYFFVNGNSLYLISIDNFINEKIKNDSIN